MITKGSQIELIKPMGLFTNVGEVCEVVNVTEDGVISFRFGEGRHLGCMSYDEYGKYFKEYEKPNKINKKPWTKWEKTNLFYFDMDAQKACVPIKYRYNGYRVQLQTDYKENNLKARASCHSTDTFDLETGLDLASARLVVKLLNREVENMAKAM